MPGELLLTISVAPGEHLIARRLALWHAVLARKTFLQAIGLRCCCSALKLIACGLRRSDRFRACSHKYIWLSLLLSDYSLGLQCITTNILIQRGAANDSRPDGILNQRLHIFVALPVIGGASFGVTTLGIHTLNAALRDDWLLVNLRVDLVALRMILKELLFGMR